MDQPSVQKSFLKELHLVRNDIFPIWNKSTEKFEIWHKDRRTGLLRVVMIVENEDGTYRPLDNRTVLYLSQSVAWNLMDKYPTPHDMAEYFLERDKNRVDKARRDRVDFLNKWINDNKSRWEKAYELAKSGIMSLPDEKEKKVFSYHNFKQQKGESNAILQPDGRPVRNKSVRQGIHV